MTLNSDNKAISIEKLNYGFGTGETAKQVLFDITLSVAPGEFAIMTGPSGSGKTTLLSLVGALRRPQSGSLRAIGHDLCRLESPGLENYRRQLGFIFQLHNLFPALTVFQSVQMATDLHPESGQKTNDRIRELLTQLGLGERMDYRPHQLSGGQRQRVAIARALVHRPTLVLADEPTAALDGENTEIVLKLLADLAHERRTTVLMITQDSRVFESADRLIHLVDGRLDPQEGPAG